MREWKIPEKMQEWKAWSPQGVNDTAKLDPWNWQQNANEQWNDYTGEDLPLLSQFWKHRMSLGTYNDRHMATSGSCEQKSSPRVAIYPDEGGSLNICWGLTKRIIHPAKKWMETQVVVYGGDMYSCSIPCKSEHLPDIGWSCWTKLISPAKKSRIYKELRRS